MKAWGGSLALALLLAVALPSSAVHAAESAEQVLLDKANYWRIKDRPDLAAESLNKLLEINPKNPEALYQYGVLSVQQNKIADAQRYLAKLQEVAPDSPHIADLQNVIRTGSVGATDLSEARRLAQAGQLDQAIKKYREIFKGPPPSEYAVEYYMTLAGTPDGWDEARQGLEKASQQSPNDAQLKLSLAQVYTYHEQTRVQGVALLAQLSKNPVVGATAIQSWRQALTWLTGSPQQKPALQQYLTQFPQDQEMAQLLADLAKQPAGTAAQSEAYEDLQKGNTLAAEKLFLADLKANPNDPQALAGLGLVRLKQQRFGEARDLLGKAIKLAPDQQKDFAAAYETAAFWARVQEAKRLTAAKNYAGARAILAPLLAHPRADQVGAMMVLGDIEVEMGDPAAAEKTYREVLRLRPGNGDAELGLIGALRVEGKTAEADQLVSRLTPDQRARLDRGGPGGGPAEKLRDEAKAASANGDVATATAKFQAAIAADPRNPWIRLDYARFLAGQGHMQEAFAAVEPTASGNTPNSILVSAMFDAQQDRWVSALDKINSIPVNQRSQDIKNFRDRVYVRGTIDRAKQYAASGNTAQARDILVQLYQDKTVTTDEKLQAPFVLIDTLHDYPTALQITRDAFMRGGPGSVKAGADYAMLLMMEGGHDEDAAKVIDQINASGQVNANNREQLTPAAITLAVRRADQLRQHGNYADAYDQISQLFADNPDDTALLMEVGRIYASAGRSREAMEYFDKAYQADSSNLDVIRGVVMGAILANRLDSAQTYLDKGMEADPNNPWFYYLKAQIAEARGNNGAAMQALRTARELNRQQNPIDTGAPTSLAPGAPAGTPPPNPFRHSQLILQDPMAAVTMAAIDNPAARGRSAQLSGSLL
ncbi:MAG TPA: tetratricopeptide repeat protein [Stellaceae bacterium]|nr:tetratricopeptide repeat protein [Stellaceae bacterium]